MSNFKTWSNYLVDHLLQDFPISDLDAFAIVGNAAHECNGFDTLQEIKPVVAGSRGGYGIMQWTGPRRREYEAYCARNGLNPAALESNYKFLFVELKGPEGRVLPKLSAASDLTSKVAVFMNVFLRPGVPHLQSRVQWANKVQKAYQPTKAEATETVETTRATQSNIWVELLRSIISAFRGNR